MDQQDLNSLSDQELLAKAKKMKTSERIHAFSIGLMLGMIIWSIINSTWGFLTLIPLFFIFHLTRGSAENEALKAVLEERGWKY